MTTQVPFGFADEPDNDAGNDAAEVTLRFAAYDAEGNPDSAPHGEYLAFFSTGDFGGGDRYTSLLRVEGGVGQLTIDQLYDQNGSNPHNIAVGTDLKLILAKPKGALPENLSTCKYDANNFTAVHSGDWMMGSYVLTVPGGVKVEQSAVALDVVANGRGTEEISADEILNKLGKAANFAVFADEFAKEGIDHVEGNVAVNVMNGTRTVGASGGVISATSLALTIKKTTTPPAVGATFYFGIYRDNVLHGVAPLTTDEKGEGSTTYTIDNAQPGSYKVFELDTAQWLDNQVAVPLSNNDKNGDWTVEYTGDQGSAIDVSLADNVNYIGEVRGEGAIFRGYSPANSIIYTTEKMKGVGVADADVRYLTEDEFVEQMPINSILENVKSLSEELATAKTSNDMVVAYVSASTLSNANADVVIDGSLGDDKNLLLNVLIPNDQDSVNITVNTLKLSDGTSLLARGGWDTDLPSRIIYNFVYEDGTAYTGSVDTSAKTFIGSMLVPAGKLIAGDSVPVMLVAKVIQQVNEIHKTAFHKPIAHKATVPVKNTDPQPETLTIRGEKTWVDSDGNPLSSGLPRTITVKVQQNSESGWIDVPGQEAQIVTADTGWSYTFRNLNKFDEHGVNYQYRVVETHIDGKPVAETEFICGPGDGEYDLKNVKKDFERRILKATKTDAVTGELLPGAVYGLYLTGEGSSDDWMGNATSDENGVITFSDADFEIPFDEDATYYFQEVRPPAGYEIDSCRSDDFRLRDLEMTIEDGVKVFTYRDAEGRGLTDERIKLEITKLSRADGAVLPGAGLAVLDKATGEELVSWVSGPEPKRFERGFNDEPFQPGKHYILRETSAPAGYVLAPDTEFTVTDEGLVELVSGRNAVVNYGADVISLVLYDDVQGDTERRILRATKTDADTGEPLPGAVYGLYLENDGADDTYLGNARGGEDGVMTFSGLDLDEDATYYLKEEVPPAGYTIDPLKSESFRLGDLEMAVEDGVKVFTFRGAAGRGVSDEKIRLEITKLSRADGAVLPGAGLAIIDKATGEELVSWVSGPEPKRFERTFGDEPIQVGKHYILRETSAPVGYVLAPDTEFTVSELGVVEVVSGGNAVVTDGTSLALYDDVQGKKDGPTSKTGDPLNAVALIGIALLAAAVLFVSRRLGGRNE